MKKKEKKKGKSNFSRTKNPRRLNSQMSERPRPPIVDPSHRRHIGTRHLSLSPPKRKLSRLKGEQRGGIPFAECNEKKKKKRKTGRAKWNICDSGSILEGGGRGKKGKERKKSILRASTVSVHSRRDKGSRVVSSRLSLKENWWN